MRKCLALVSCLVLSACAQNIETPDGQSQWDFDHKVQFKQTKLSEHNYRIEVIPNSKAKFGRLATFLIRHSLEVCNSYGFKLEVLTGVEGYTDRKAHPNKIFGSLSANLECPHKPE